MNETLLYNTDEYVHVYLTLYLLINMFMCTYSLFTDEYVHVYLTLYLLMNMFMCT